MDFDGVFTEDGEVAGDAVVPARSDGHDQVAVQDGLVGVGRTVHAEHADGEGVVFWEDALAEEGGGDGNLERLCELQELFFGTCQHGAVAGQDEWLLGLGEGLGDVLDGLAIAVLWRGIAGQVELDVVVGHKGGGGDVFGHVDEDDAWASALRQVEGFFDDARDVVDVTYQVRVFDDGHGEAQDVCFLEGVHTERAGDGLAGDDDHGHGVHLCGHHAGDGVGSAGS